MYHKLKRVNMNLLTIALNRLGLTTVGKACGVSRQAVACWRNNGKLPNTEHLPIGNEYRTDYAKIISKLAGCKRQDLL